MGYLPLNSRSCDVLDNQLKTINKFYCGGLFQKGSHYIQRAFRFFPGKTLIGRKGLYQGQGRQIDSLGEGSGKEGAVPWNGPKWSDE
jgi:hypothetical protein